jgi:ribonuclease-3
MTKRKRTDDFNSGETQQPHEHNRLSKVGRLVGLLDELLQENSEQEHDDEWDFTTQSQCRELLRSLVERNLASQSRRKPSPGTVSENHVPKPKLPTIPPPSTISAWTTSSILETLPPLPKIKDPVLEVAAFTHSAMVNASSPTSYERLEFLGDAYIELISTLLISATFPNLSAGKSAQLRELVVKNETLASYARQYHFEQRAQLPREYLPDYTGLIKPTAREMIKVYGDIFEAYVAAVILSDPIEGVSKVSEWLKALWAKTLSKQIADQERQNNEQEKRKDEGTSHSHLPLKVQLRNRIGAKGVTIGYRDVGSVGVDPATGFPLYTRAAFFSGWGEKDKELGRGMALGKKEADVKAVEAAFANWSQFKVYEEMKKAFDQEQKSKQQDNTSS